MLYTTKKTYNCLNGYLKNKLQIDINLSVMYATKTIWILYNNDCSTFLNSKIFLNNSQASHFQMKTGPIYIYIYIYIYI